MQNEILSRCERKFLTGPMSLDEVRRLVLSHPMHFEQAWPERRINNIYFDTRTLHLYRLSTEGIASRRKIRVRWYGDTSGSHEVAYLEEKSKDGIIVNKKSYDLEDFQLARGSTLTENILGRISGHIDPGLRAELRIIEPVLINRYTRQYYISTRANIRLTLDSNLEYALPRYRPGSRFYRDPGREIILELKYPVNLEESAALSSQLFRFRLSRMSKYVRGMAFLHNDP